MRQIGHLPEVISCEYFESYQLTRDHFLFHLVQALYLRNGSIYKKVLDFFFNNKRFYVRVNLSYK